jgi:hypothetical protein
MEAGLDRHACDGETTCSFISSISIGVTSASSTRRAFDEGSALYYARRVADKIGRDADYGSLRVEVRTSEGTLLASIAPSEGRGCEQLALVGRLYPGSFRGADSASRAALGAASSRS